MYKIIYYGKKELRTPCKKIEKHEFNEDLIKLSNSMYKIMLKAQGVGLAANQIGINKQIAIIQIQKGQRIDLVNPEIELVNNSMEEAQEGCLSIPQVFSFVKRYVFLKVKAYNLFGQVVHFKASHLLARVIQHEIDHLNGFLYIDRLSEENKKNIIMPLKNLNKNHEFLTPNAL